MNKFSVIIFVVGISLFSSVHCVPVNDRLKGGGGGGGTGEAPREYDDMHPQLLFRNLNKYTEEQQHQRVRRGAMPELKFQANNIEQDIDYWNNVAQSTLQEQLKKNKLNKNLAKNVIMFLGDGMSIPTLAATRMYMGGEEKVLSFEEFPYTGLSKTYCANTQVADSACSATAYLGGVKANYATIGVSASVVMGDCRAENDTMTHISSIAQWAQKAGLSTGLITTTHVTHASPAGVFAHTANRNWEYDQILLDEGGDPHMCHDIAKQLIYHDVGKHLKVILGGGRSMFLPTTTTDIEGKPGKRTDGVNLIQQWKLKHKRKNHRATYVETKNELLNISHNTEYLFGLFDSTHLPYYIDADKNLKPSLSEMVSKALDILERDEKGYFLFVEGGRIDHGHHDSQAIRALDETVEFHKAIDLVKKRTNDDETLIVVTADHSHTMTISGYSSRGNDILGINDSQFGTDKLPYATLSYANGPGYRTNMNTNGIRRDLKETDMKISAYEFPSAVPLEKETHGGDDVAVFASGPWSHLFSGTYEQNFIPHAMAYAACIGRHSKSCHEHFS